MREILFRGKRKDNGEWVYGFLIKGNRTYIATCNAIEYMVVSLMGRASLELVEVIPYTIGQYTGLKDKNGTKIFEGDIVLYSWLSFGEPPFCIEFIDGEFCATPLRQTDDLWQIRISGENLNFEVIGNIHDNPELLEVEL